MAAVLSYNRRLKHKADVAPKVSVNRRLHTDLKKLAASSLSSNASKGQQVLHVGPLVVLYEVQPKCQHLLDQGSI